MFFEHELDGRVHQRGPGHDRHAAVEEFAHRHAGLQIHVQMVAHVTLGDKAHDAPSGQDGQDMDAVIGHGRGGFGLRTCPLSPARVVSPVLPPCA